MIAATWPVSLNRFDWSRPEEIAGDDPRGIAEMERNSYPAARWIADCSKSTDAACLRATSQHSPGPMVSFLKAVVIEIPEEC